ncbi:MAG: RagB/SusD family nutrient uptake outer membrane protein [Mangrovibacterium sp.]
MNFSPTQNLIDDYLVTDTDGKEKAWDQTSYLSGGRNVNEKMYQHRDKRFYATIVYDSTKYFNNWAYTRADGNVSNNISPLNGGCIMGGCTSTGYLFKKYVYQDKKIMVQRSY